MEIILIILQFLADFLLQVFGEALVQLVFRILAETLGFGKNAALHPAQVHPTQTNPIAATIGYGLAGGLTGGLTLLVFPDAFVSAPTLRVINLFFGPVLVGLLMMMVGKRQPQIEPPTKRRQDAIEVYRFTCGFVFAFAIALVRFIWAR